MLGAPPRWGVAGGWVGPGRPAEAGLLGRGVCGVGVSLRVGTVIAEEGVCERWGQACRVGGRRSEGQAA